MPAASASAYLTAVLLNVTFLLVGIFLAHRAIGADLDLWSLLGGVLIVFSMVGPEIHSIWIPAKIELPLFAYFFSLVLLAQRRLQYWPVACLLVSVLIHGYLSMIVIALPILFVAMAWGFYHDRRIVDATETRYLVLGVLISCFFASPIAVDAFINNPSNLEKILKVAGDTARPSRLLDIVHMLNEHAFRRIGLIHITALLAGAYVLQTRTSQREKWRLCLLVALAMTTIFILYHMLAPSPMYIPMVRYMQAVPMALICLCVIGLFQFVGEIARARGRYWYTATTALMAVAIVGVTDLRPVTIQPGAANHIRQLALGALVAVEKSGRAVINYTQHDQWPTVAGVLFELKLKHVNACTTWRDMQFLYTASMVCEEGAVPNIVLMPESECNNRCVIRAGGTGLELLEGPL